MTCVNEMAAANKEDCRNVPLRISGMQKLMQLMLHVCSTEVTKAQTNPCWLVQG